MKVKNLNEAYESPNIDQPSFVDAELERIYGPIRKMINDGDYEAAEKELDELTADLDEFEAQNKKKRFFKYPQFMIDEQRNNIKALRAKLPAKVKVDESVDDMEKRCEKCNTLLNDRGTCPKCDDGEEDYGDKRLQLDESIFDNTKLTLDEEVLNEGPLGPALRKFGRSAADKFAPKSAEKRQISGHKKDDEAQHEKHAYPILARDFTTKAQKWTFYPNVKNPKGMDFDAWWERYKHISTNPKNNKDLYAEWYNACVVDPDGYYIRRGSEDMQKQLIKYEQGVNDKVLNMYRVDPYTWYQKDNEIPLPPEFDDGGDEVGEDSNEKKTGENKKGENKKGGNKKGRKETGEKKPTAVGAPELDRFRRLCKLTSLRVYDKASKNELTFEDICKIKPETISNYFVDTQYGRKSSLDVWFQAAIKSKFLYKLPEYIERFYKKTLNEDALNESPKIQLDGVDLINPDSVNFKELTKRATENERAELAAKADAEARNKLRAKYKNVIDVASQYQNEDPEEALEVLFNILVPVEGAADTVAGEMVRAMTRIMYRSYNDGDMFFTGYGIETCAPSAMYLYNHGLDVLVDEILEKASMIDDDKYNELLKKMAKQVVDYIVKNPETITTPNNEDSRKCNAEYIIDQQPKFEFEFYGSEDIVTLVDANIIDSWTLKDYVEDQLRYGGRHISEFEIERPWTHHDHQIIVSGLTRDDLDFIENDLFRDVDSFWESLVDEYADDLEELENEYDEDESKDDIDESIVMESANNYYFRHGDEVLDEMNGNLGDKELDYQIKYLNRIARKLGLKRVEDLVVFCDDEWSYDPTMFDNRFLTLPEQPNEFNVNGVTFIAAKEFNQIWLYFRNEEDGSAYLGYCDEEHKLI